MSSCPSVECSSVELKSLLGGSHGTGCVPLEKFLTLSAPFSLLANDDNTGTWFLRSLCPLNELMLVNNTAPDLESNKENSSAAVCITSRTRSHSCLWNQLICHPLQGAFLDCPPVSWGSCPSWVLWLTLTSAVPPPYHLGGNSYLFGLLPSTHCHFLALRGWKQITCCSKTQVCMSWCRGDSGNIVTRC